MKKINEKKAEWKMNEEMAGLKYDRWIAQIIYYTDPSLHIDFISYVPICI